MASEDYVTLVTSEHATWPRMAGEMAMRITEHLPAVKVEHIGSTAVPGMPAKPVVDLAVGMLAGQVEDAASELAKHGFDIEGTRQSHAWLSYPDRSTRSFVIHVFEFQGTEWHRRLRFRDILITDATSDYTRAKSSVVSEILNESTIRRVWVDG